MGFIGSDGDGNGVISDDYVCSVVMLKSVHLCVLEMYNETFSYSPVQ